MRGRQQTPMDVAATGLMKAGTALTEAVELARIVLPQAYELAERGIEQLTRIADTLEAAQYVEPDLSPETDTIYGHGSDPKGHP